MEVLKQIVSGIFKVMLLLVWWTVMLFIASLLLTSVWKVGWVELLLYAAGLTLLSIAGYGICKWAGISKKKHASR